MNIVGAKLVGGTNLGNGRDRRMEHGRDERRESGRLVGGAGRGGAGGVRRAGGGEWSLSSERGAQRRASVQHWRGLRMSG
jgi:hypothetical protein